MERKLLLLFIFFIPVQSRLVLVGWTMPFNEWTAGFLWGTDILLTALFVLWFVRSLKKPSSFRREDLLVGLFVAIAAASIAHALIPAVSWYRLLKLIEFAGFMFYLRGAVGRVITIAELCWALAVSGVFQALVGVNQYLMQSDLGLRLLGESPLVPGHAGVAVVPTNPITTLRAYGTTPHPNVLAAWLMVCLWAGAWLVFKSSDRRRVLFTSYAVMLTAFLLTFSRVSIALWLLGSAIMLTLWAWREYRETCRRLVGISALVAGLVLILCWPQVRARLTLSSEEEAISQRIFYNRLALQGGAGGGSWLGSGIGQFVPGLMRRFPGNAANLYQPAHNTYLLVLQEVGVVGLLVLLIFLGVIIRYTHRRMIVVVACVLALGLTDHLFWTLQQGGMLFWGLLALAGRGIIPTR